MVTASFLVTDFIEPMNNTDALSRVIGITEIN
jgi:hypothetical protein